MNIEYLKNLDEQLVILKNKKLSNHNYLVTYYKKRYGYADRDEIILQLKNRRDCLLFMIENFSSDFALLDYALSDRFKSHLPYFSSKP